MSDENKVPPEDQGQNTPADETPAQDNADAASQDSSQDTGENGHNEGGQDDDRMNERLERLGGEPAPVITPEEFARLQKAGQVHIDQRGRVRTERPRGVDPGVSLRKRRAWYARR